MVAQAGQISLIYLYQGWGGWSRNTKLPGNNRMRCQLRYTPSIVKGNRERGCVCDLGILKEVILILILILIRSHFGLYRK